MYPNDTIRRRRSGSPLAQMIAWCLTPQNITETNDDVLSRAFCGIPRRAIPLEVKSICNMFYWDYSLRITTPYVSDEIIKKYVMLA